MKKIFLFLIYTPLLFAQIKETETRIMRQDSALIVRIVQSDGSIYKLGLGAENKNKTDIELKNLAINHYSEIKNREANPVTNDYKELRRVAYPPLADQLDMIYWDMKNGTKKWIELIDSIKTKYPKN